MSVHTVTKGLDLPITGVPAARVDTAPAVSRVAVTLRDFVGLKVRVLVSPGQAVRLGEPLLEHRTYGSVRLVSPGAGRVEAVHRGDKRALQSVVIALDTPDAGSDGLDDAVRFAAFTPDAAVDRAGVRALLLESGLWTAFRTRPFSMIPDPESVPASIFVTAIDTHPLAPDLDVALRGREDDVARGFAVLTRLTDGPVYCCRRPDSRLGGVSGSVPGVIIEEFQGPHPAGTVGYHIHTLDPVYRDKTVWHLGVQDVARIGHVFATGRLDPTQIIAVGGPQVREPRMLRTRLGASVTELLEGALHTHAEGEGVSRVVSGSVLNGDRIEPGAHEFLGRFHQQLSVIPEGGAREFLGWMAPGATRFSALPTFLSALRPRLRFALDTRLHGSRRAMVPIGAYERVMPMDLMPTHLLRALTVGDLEWAEELGVLELDEEDLALCTFVCPGKYEHGAALRRALMALAAER